MKQTAPEPSIKADADRLADFVIFTQRNCILNLSTELINGNVSFSQFFLLAYLSSEEYLTMSDIAKKIGHSTAAATGVVDRLESLSYVERVHATEDRRKILVRITPKGDKLVAKLRKEIASQLATLLAEMDEDAAPPVEVRMRAKDSHETLPEATPPARTPHESLTGDRTAGAT